MTNKDVFKILMYTFESIEPLVMLVPYPKLLDALQFQSMVPPPSPYTWDSILLWGCKVLSLSDQRNNYHQILTYWRWSLHKNPVNASWLSYNIYTFWPMHIVPPYSLLAGKVCFNFLSRIKAAFLRPFLLTVSDILAPSSLRSSYTLFRLCNLYL